MNQRAFTLVELLVVISIIALLVGILLPAISRARDNAKISQSKSNIRNIYNAHIMYSNDHNDRPFTATPEVMSSGPDGSWCHLTAQQATTQWRARYWSGSTGTDSWTVLPGIWNCETGTGGHWFPFDFPCHIFPYCYPEGKTVSIWGYPRVGTFRFTNSRQIAEYMEDKCYHKAFWAPKDRVIIREISQCWDGDGTYCNTTLLGGSADLDIPLLLQPSTYGLSPPAMVNSACYRKPVENEDPKDAFTDPMDIMTGFKAPSMGQGKFTSQKSFLMEMHWLNNQTSGECGPNWSDSTVATYHVADGDNNEDSWSYDGCYPHYFNASFRSSPVTIMRDGSVTQISVEMAEKDDYVIANGNDSTNDVATYKGSWHRGVNGDFEWGFFLECHSDWSLWSGHTHTAGGVFDGIEILAH
jgi:prepilin-type N-terminal cleavage/methylation domain-containing protein